MPKDFTDFVVMICDSKETVILKKHFYNWPEDSKVHKTSLDGRHYHLMRDRAFRMRWKPWTWEEANWKKPWLIVKELLRKKKVGLLLYQETDEPQQALIEPIHISRISQPSGQIDDDRPDEERTDLTDKISPFVLKMIVDASSKYRKAYKSYAFGLKQKLMSNWVILLLLGIVGVFMLLYLTGYIRI